MRGNGDAVVSLRVIFSNLEDTPQSELTLKSPGHISDLVAYQAVRQPICARYRPIDYTQKNISYTPICEEYRQPEYYEYNYGQNTYYKAQLAQDGDTLKITLPKIVAPGSTGSFLLYFRSPSYTHKKLLGGYDFTFESLKTEDKIHTLQVGISTDSDLVLRDAKSNVNYTAPSAGSMKLNTVADAGMQAPQLDAVYNQIGQGMIVKNASDLQPLDTYTVKGSYAEHTWQLYGREIGIGLVILLVVLAVIAWIVRRLFRFFAARPAVKGAVQMKSAATVWVAIVGMSFLSAIVIAGYTIALFLFFSFLGSSYYYNFNMILSTLAVIISIGLYLIFTFVPAIFIGIKRGVWYGVAAFACTIGWLIMFSIIAFVLMFAVNMRPPSPGYPVMYNTTSTMEK